MSHQTLDTRRQALEESFFKKENERVLGEFRENMERKDLEDHLSAVSGITDGTLLDRLFDSGFRAETWIAISLVPLVEVAWADGELSDGEREAILGAATNDGITGNDAAQGLLEGWLKRRPRPQLREDWKAYVKAIVPLLDESEKAHLKRETLERSKTVARAASGLLGLARWISHAEEEVINDLMSCFEADQ